MSRIALSRNRCKASWQQPIQGLREMLIDGHIVALVYPGSVPELARSLADEPRAYTRVEDVHCVFYTPGVETSDITSVV
ncbi:hypothetical protein Q7C36_022432 [Tachysurus vachellii]|uniref:Uncharacterized protein n=1 Tax=Tachysurus vachellii TaxID=175792 RepID=A0AA88IMT2_TACVA|nr:hypothetical protein Q7C36_022432 [Tachysurus vachellii]